MKLLVLSSYRIILMHGHGLFKKKKTSTSSEHEKTFATSFQRGESGDKTKLQSTPPHMETNLINTRIHDHPQTVM